MLLPSSMLADVVFLNRSLNNSQSYSRKYSGAVLSCHLIQSRSPLGLTPTSWTCVSGTTDVLKDVEIKAYFHCSVVELSVGVICSSVPHLPALFRQQRLGLSRIRSALYHLVHGSSQQSKRSSDLPLHEYECVTEESKSENFKVNTEVLGSIQGYVLSMAQYKQSSFRFFCITAPSKDEELTRS